MIFTLMKGRFMHAVAADFLDFDLLTIVIAYLLITYGHGASSAYAFGQGLFVDVISGGPQGFSTLIYLAVFWGLYVGSRFFELHHPRSQIFLVAVAVLLKEILLIGMLDLFVSRMIIMKSFPLMVLGSMMVTALSAPLLFGFFDYLLALPGEDHAGG
jgi:rod shape-determining protein MreD